MKNKNIIEYNGKPAFVIVPYDEYQKMVKLKKQFKTDEDLYLEVISKDDEYFPEELVKKILGGHNPIRIYREYRGLSQQQLAIKVGKTKQYISSLENKTRNSTIPTLKKIAAVLQVSVDMLN